MLDIITMWIGKIFIVLATLFLLDIFINKIIDKFEIRRRDISTIRGIICSIALSYFINLWVLFDKSLLSIMCKMTIFLLVIICSIGIGFEFKLIGIPRWRNYTNSWLYFFKKDIYRIIITNITMPVMIVVSLCNNWYMFCIACIIYTMAIIFDELSSIKACAYLIKKFSSPNE